MLKGGKVNLMPIEREDLPLLKYWRNLPEYRKYFREYKEINNEMQEKWYDNKVIDDNSTLMFSIKSIDNSQLLGCCGLCYINWIHRYADLSLYIGWNETYIDKEGYAEDSCKILFDYGFNELNLNKIWTEIYEFDDRKYELYHKLGFKNDGLLREQYYYEGKWWNSHILSLLKREYLQIN